ncbi:phage tail protein [Cohnella caldifontis]|uniref:phage tail protein n=1 Tax=Cohnella caldifontis TaxID=3027471 RepID=UPI0023ED2E47|nr:phage tail protein [Cohnella sp. YIM B05605]
MTENEAAFFSVNQPEHWRRKGVLRNLDVSRDGVSLERGQKYGVLDTIALEGLDGAGDAAAFAVGSLGRLIILDDEGNLWIYDRGSRQMERMFMPGNGLLSPASQLAVRGDTLFAADPRSPSGEPWLAAFDLVSGQLRWSRSGSEIEGLPYMPAAAAADDRFFYVLSAGEKASPDADADRGIRLAVLKLTFSGSLEAEWTDDSFRIVPPASDADWRSSLFLHPSPGGGVYALDATGCRVFAFGGDGSLRRRIELPPRPCAGLAADSKGNFYVGDARRLNDGEEDDRFVLQYDGEGRFLGPVGGFRGRTDGLAVDGQDRMVIRSREARTLTVLELQQRVRGLGGDGPPEGVWLSFAFDSAEAETVWHKFTLDADIPDGTMIRASYYSSDSDLHLIRGSAWKIDDWISHDGHTLEEKLAGLSPLWSPPVVNPADALFLKAKGRYLWIKAEWIGSEMSTPTLRKLRVYFPRSSPLSYLPSVYQEEETSRDFLERYLSLFGTLFDSVDERIDRTAEFFDPEHAGGKQLRWLASWLGLSCDDHWSDDWVRRLIRAAPELHRYRGTRRGIEILIETLTGRRPIIVEPFQYKTMRESGELKWLTDDLYAGDPFTFTLLLHQDQARTDKERVLLRELVEDYKPAYTQARIQWLQPWMYLDLHTYLGVNTTLAEPSLLTLHPDRMMPNDTLIAERDMDRRMDAHTRLEMDSELE